MDHDQLRVGHFGNAVNSGLGEITLDKADVAFPVLLLVVAVPVGDLGIDSGRGLGQGIVVAGPEDIADGMF